MKKYLKYFLLTASLVSTLTFKTYASVSLPSNVRLEGNAQGIFFIPGQKPFLEKNNMLPGDVVPGEIVIENTHNDEYDLYMRAEKITPDETYDLIKKINLLIEYKGNELYKGDMSGQPDLDGNIYLGRIKPGEKEVLDAKAELDKSAGNEYKNKFGQVNWIFTAVKKLDSYAKADGIKEPSPPIENENPNNGIDKKSNNRDKPDDKKSDENKPDGNKSSDNKSDGNKSNDDKSGDKKPDGNKSTDNKSDGNKSDDNKLNNNKPDGNKSTDNKSSDKKPDGNKSNDKSNSSIINSNGNSDNSNTNNDKSYTSVQNQNTYASNNGPKDNTSKSGQKINGKSPYTGDTGIMMYIIGAVASLILLFVIRKKKGNLKDER